MIEEWDLTATNLRRARQRKYELAVIPTAAIEPHNLHLPQGQDWLHATAVSRECCRRAWDRCESVLWLPAIPYGVDANLMHFPLAVHVSQATLDAMLRDVITSLRKHGIRKFVLFNAHGGNDFSPLVRQIQCDMDVYVFVVNWWTVGDDRYDAFFDKPDDHAGEFETSVALALFEDLVELEHAGDGRPRRFAFEALRNGWAKTSRDFAKVNDQCAVGDPSGASAQRGQAYLELVYDRVSAFLAALASAPIDEHFPMASENRDEPS